MIMENVSVELLCEIIHFEKSLREAEKENRVGLQSNGSGHTEML